MERKISKAKIDANRRFNDKTYERVSFSARKELQINALVSVAAKKANISKAEYMLTAITRQLAEDHVSLCNLEIAMNNAEKLLTE